MIKNENGKFVLYNEDGSKQMGSFDSEDEAQKREKQIVGFAKRPANTNKFGAIKMALMKPKLPKI